MWPAGGEPRHAHGTPPKNRKDTWLDFTEYARYMARFYSICTERTTYIARPPTEKNITLVGKSTRRFPCIRFRLQLRNQFLIGELCIVRPAGSQGSVSASGTARFVAA